MHRNCVDIFHATKILRIIACVWFISIDCFCCLWPLPDFVYLQMTKVTQGHEYQFIPDFLFFQRLVFIWTCFCVNWTPSHTHTHIHSKMMNDVNWIQQTIPAFLFLSSSESRLMHCRTTQRHFFTSVYCLSLTFFFLFSKIMTFYWNAIALAIWKGFQS